MESIVYMPTWANVIFVSAIILLVIALLWKNILTITAKVKNIPLEFRKVKIQSASEESDNESDVETDANILKIRDIAVNKNGYEYHPECWTKTIVFSDGGCIEAPYKNHSEWRIAKKGDKVVKEGSKYHPL